MDNHARPAPRARAIKWALAATAAALLLALILLFTLDLGFLRGAIEERVREATGRSFVINGPVSVRVGREVRFSAEGIELGNAEWAGPDPMARVMRVEGRIETRSLLSGPLTVRALEVNGLELSLVQDAEGRANWLLGEEPTTDESAPGLRLGSLDVTGSVLRLQSPKLDRALALDITHLHHNETLDGYIEANIQARLNGNEVRFEGRLGPAARLVEGKQITAQGAGALGRTELEFEALFDHLWQPVAPRLTARLSGPELAELTEMLGIEGLGNGPVDLQLGAEPTEGRLALTARGRLGELEVDATAAMPSLADMRDSQLTARLAGPNFGRLARLAGYPGWPENAFTLDTAVRRPGDGLDIERLDITMAGAQLKLTGALPAFPAMAGAALNLNAEGRDIAPFEQALGLSDLPRGAFRINGEVRSGDQDQAQLALDYSFPIARGRITGELGGGADLLGTDLDISGQGQDAQALGDSFGLNGLPKAQWTLALDLAITEPGFYRLDKLAFSAGGLRADFQGRLDAERLMEAFDLRFDLAGPRLSALQNMLGEEPALPEQPFQARGRAKADGALWQLTGVEGSLGTTTFTADGTLGMGEGNHGTDLRVTARGQDLGALAPLPPPLTTPGGAYELETRLALKPGGMDITGLRLDAGTLALRLEASVPWPIDASGGRFDFEAKGQDITRILPELAGYKLKPNAFDARFKGDWTEQAFRFEKGEARIADAQISALGTLAVPPAVNATNLRVELNAPDLGRLALAPEGAWSSMPLSLKATFSGSGQRLQADTLRAQLGENIATGRFSVNFEPQRPDFEFALNADALDLKPFQPAPAATAAKPTERMIPDITYPMDALAQANGRFEIKAGRLALRQGTFRNAVVQGRIQEGALTVSELGVDGYRGRLALRLDLKPEGGVTAVTLGAQARDFVLDAEGLSAEQKAASPAYTADLDLRGRGRDLRETAATLAGDIRLESEGGTFYRRKKEGARQQLLAGILAAVKPELARQDGIKLACVSGAVNARDGRLAFTPGITAYTEKLHLHAGGGINLANEQLDLSVRTQERQSDPAASERFSPALKVSGTLAAHSIGIDSKGTLLSGGASFLKGGLSDLAKLALAKDSGGADPCAEMLRARARQTPPGSE